MKMKDIEFGMKVTPHSKNIECSFSDFLKEKEGEFYEKNGYLYVVRKLRDKIWLGIDIKNSLRSFTFLPSDVEINKAKDDIQKYKAYSALLDSNITTDKEEVEEMKKNTLLDNVFQNHVEVELRNGIKGIVVGNQIHRSIDGYYSTMKGDYNRFLCSKINNGFDIMKATLNEKIIYKREEEWSEWREITDINNKPMFYRKKESRIQVKIDGIIGESKCMPNDKFVLQRGIDIAYNRVMIKLHQRELDRLVK